jgi:hypothetical protein
MKRIATAGNVIVPALLTLERLGFTVSTAGASLLHAKRGDEEYVGEDPVAVLGLIKLVETRTWDWKPTDAEIQEVIERYQLG